MKRRIVLWFVGCITLSVLVAAALSETAFRLLKTAQDRAPTRIELIIPPGTAAEVARGKNPPGISDTMVFVVGDTLVVNNQDSQAHQLGPLWVPAGSSASLSFDHVESYAFACSFLSGKYLGLDVAEPITLTTRAVGILSAGVPLGALMALYIVFAVLPDQKVRQG
jgi:hypothetical protein